MSPRTSDAREQLIRAAQTLYAVQGVAATTPREVLVASGIGQGSLYHHFPTKHDLADAAVEATASANLARARETLGGDDAPMARIRAYLLRDRDAVAGCRVGRLTADPMVMTTPSLRSDVAEYFTGLLELVDGALREAGYDAAAAAERASTIVAVVQGGYVLARATGDQGQFDRAVRGLLALLPADGGAQHD